MEDYVNCVPKPLLTKGTYLEPQWAENNEKTRVVTGWVIKPLPHPENFKDPCPSGELLADVQKVFEVDCNNVTKPFYNPDKQWLAPQFNPDRT